MLLSRFLKAKQAGDSQLNSYLDEFMQREVLNRKLMVNDMRARLASTR